MQKILQEKNLSDQIIFRWNSFMKNGAQKINFIRLFSLFLKTFENLNHDLTLRTLSSVYIHGLKGDVHTP